MILIRHGQTEFNRVCSVIWRDPGIRDPALLRPPPSGGSGSGRSADGQPATSDQQPPMRAFRDC
jgi:hypothetical protein